MDQAITRLSLRGREIALVGTAHVSRESVAEVTRIIEEEKPDRVCVELDEGRHRAMTGGSSWQNLDIGKVLREGKGFLLLANLVLASFQRRLGADLGVKPGEEMLAAVNAAGSLGIPCSLCDREISTTLRRAWARTSFWGKNKMLAAMLSSVFSSEKLSREEIEELKQKDMLQSMLDELAGYLPTVKEVLIDERDTYLAEKIGRADGARIVAVVGAGHVPGIVAYLNAMGSEPRDLSALETIPVKKLGARLAPWIVPAALVVLFGLGFLKSGWQMSLEMALKWLLANGGLAAAGSLLAFAHPLTIVVAFVGAPIATLNPFVGIGLFTGIAEAFLRKPRVRDFENLQTDVASVKGFYTNRVTHILLVFLLSSIGGMIGNFIAIPWITALLRGGK
ncbi:MAG: TraB/GumN family protein [Spirochaetes bacterium]|nr:TraB/GumN family protein [Spirochaetota bacterium]